MPSSLFQDADTKVGHSACGDAAALLSPDSPCLNLPPKRASSARAISSNGCSPIATPCPPPYAKPEVILHLHATFLCWSRTKSGQNIFKGSRACKPSGCAHRTALKMLTPVLRSAFPRQPQPGQHSQARGSQTPLSPGFGGGTGDRALTLDAKSTRRASHHTFLARDRQKHRAPGCLPPSLAHRPAGRAGAAPEQP